MKIFVREGENTFAYTLDWYEHEGVHFALYDPLATESLRNCLYYDSSFENAYIKGDFVLGEDFRIKKRTALPQFSENLHKEGYPFFKGEVVYEGVISYDGEGKKVLSLRGDFLVADVEINGVKVPFVFDKKKDITKYLQKGKNDVKIEVRVGLRNLIGPHHYKPNPKPQYRRSYLRFARSGIKTI